MASNNFLKEILQGGACNPDQSQARQHQSSNPLQNFFQDVFLGKARISQKIGSFYPDEAIPEDLQGGSPKQAGLTSLQENKLIEHPNNARFEKYWRDGQMELNRQREIGKRDFQKEWKKEQTMVPQNFQPKTLHLERNNVNDWQSMHDMRNEILLRTRFNQYNPGFAPNNQMVQPNTTINSKQQEESKENIRNLTQQSIENTVDNMEKDTDPRFKESKFLSFLKKVQNGEHAVQNLRCQDFSFPQSQVVDSAPPAKTEEFDQDFELEMEDAWEEAEDQVAEEEKQDSAVFETCKIDMKQRRAEMEALEETKATDSNKEDEEALSDDEDFDLGLESAYEFTENNPYLHENNPFGAALKFLNAGDTGKAVLCLESHLQKNPDNEEAWMLLGKIYQDSDQEKHAIDCFLKAIKLNSKNLSTLLSLGVSLTNKSDQVRAMKCLSRWVLTNQKLKTSKEDRQTLREICQNVNYSMTLNKIRGLNEELIEVFNRISKLKPCDPELHSTQAILHFVAKNYNASLYHFNEALKADPKNYSLWNRLGATLAHLGKSDEAIESYYRALEFKPNFVRAWTNLGVAQAFKGEYEEAIRLYLTALSINPNAQQIWEHLKVTLIAFGKYELAEKSKSKDLSFFKDLYQIISLEDLPPPEIEYQELHKNSLYKEFSEEWILTVQRERGG